MCWVFCSSLAVVWVDSARVSCIAALGFMQIHAFCNGVSVRDACVFVCVLRGDDVPVQQVWGRGRW